MICANIRRLCSQSPQSYIQSCTNNIQRFESRKVCDKVDQHLHKISSRWIYSSQYSIIQRANIDELKAIQCEKIKTQLNDRNVFFARNFGLLQTSSTKNYPMYQARRFFGDSVASPAMAIAVGSNAPIGQYETLVKLLYNNVVVEYVQNSLVSLHSCTGLPWWVDIVLCTIAAKAFITFPLALYQELVAAKLVNIKHEMDDAVRELKAEADYAVVVHGLTETRARTVYNRSLKKKWNELVVRDNCHPAKTVVLVFVQLPLWISLSVAYRNLCFMLPVPTLAAHETFMQLSVGGFGWISDLTSIDSYWVFPILLGVLNIMNIELRLLHRREPTRFQVIISKIHWGLSILLVPLAGMSPSCIGLYWVTSSACGVVQNFCIASPRLRRLVGIPESQLDHDHPYQLFYSNLKKKYAWIKNLY